MAIEVNGNTVEMNDAGFLQNVEDWNKDIAAAIAEQEGIVLTDGHWDLINYLREEFLNNSGNQPNNRAILKAMSAKWGKKVDSKALYDLFPGNPSKQAGQIGGLPESRRKGGY